jgi:peptide/nickel transport system ATP-binding protein
MKEGNNILDIRNLTVEFKTGQESITAVDDISFSLYKGETLGIVGESGSGKSVTALSIMQLIPDAGKITGGQLLYHLQKQERERIVDLAKIPGKEKRMIRGKEIAIIFQEPVTSLNPVLTCGEQVMEAIRLHFRGISKKESRDRTIELFEKVLLPRPDKIFDIYPHQISGGQKQRVMIAMAISCDPRVLIADEPTTALDVTVQAAIIDLLKKLQSENGLSMVFISHDLGVIAEIADRVLVMHKGKIVECGSLEQVFKSPEHPYTKGLLACRPPLNRKLRRLPVISDFMTNDNREIQQVTAPDIKDVQASYEIPQEETAMHKKKLYARTPVLQVENISAWYPLRTGFLNREKQYIKAVDDVSFEVYPGETLGLVGESGCGKTTLGRTILRLIEPHSGKVIFKGKNLNLLTRNEMRLQRKNLQIIFQDPYSSLNPRMTIGDAIMEPMKVHGLHQNDSSRKRHVTELLERVNMEPSHYSRYPYEFSGGQRQRIAIARALAVQPEFIICDESVSALDVSVQAQVLNLLNDLKKEFSLSYIFISHDLSVVKFMSDRMVVMNKGKIEELGSPDEIYRNPSSDYTKKLISAIPKGL